MDIRPHRRSFLSAAAASSALVISTPYLITRSRTSQETVIGEGEHVFRVDHDWAQLPDKYTWQTTHNVAFDSDGQLYVIHEGRFDQKDHPSIFVFDQKGKFVRGFGEQFQGGGHGIEVRQEGNEEFLYVAAYQQRKTIAKLNLKGETVWQRFAPMESGVYASGEDELREIKWGRQHFNPTNFAFLDDGDFLLVDGYGAYCVHRYDKDGNWKSHFGKPGDGEGTFNTPHGIWIDDRDGEPKVVICDRAHHTLQWLTLDGKHLRTQKGFGLPANIDIREDLLLVPELHARVTILNKENEPVARLGADVERVTSDNFTIRKEESKWLQGKFVHPHDACFDADGNILVAEWVHAGRVTRLTRV